MNRNTSSARHINNIQSRNNSYKEKIRDKVTVNEVIKQSKNLKKYQKYIS